MSVEGRPAKLDWRTVCVAACASLLTLCANNLISLSTIPQRAEAQVEGSSVLMRLATLERQLGAIRDGTEAVPRAVKAESAGYAANAGDARLLQGRDLGPLGIELWDHCVNMKKQAYDSRFFQGRDLGPLGIELWDHCVNMKKAAYMAQRLQERDANHFLMFWQLSPGGGNPGIFTLTTHAGQRHPGATVVR